jgi:NADPH2:quinone reductase
MKAWRMHAWGEPEDLVFEDVDVPAPGPNQVRIRVRAAALNFFDVLLVQGKYQVKPPFPFTPGAEVAGEVESVGEGVTHVKPGDRVLALPQIGGYGEATIADAARTFVIPEGMTFEQGAAMPIVYHTSLFALRERAQLQPGEWLLVHAGASGVGMSAIQIGRAMGAHVIATASSEEKLAFAREQGAEHTFLYNDESWVESVRALTKTGADVIYDPVGGDVFHLSTKALAMEGRLLVIGFASGTIPDIALNRVLLKDISIVGVHWGAYANAHPRYPAEAHAMLAQMFARGEISPVVTASTPLDDAPRAMRALTTRRAMGKTVLTAG